MRNKRKQNKLQTQNNKTNFLQSGLKKRKKNKIQKTVINEENYNKTIKKIAYYTRNYREKYKI